MGYAVKNIIIFYLVYLFIQVANATVGENDLLSISLDKQFYFIDSKTNDAEIIVRNTGTGLAYVDVQLFNGFLKHNDSGNDELHFDINKKLTNYDIYPSTIILPPKQERKIKLIRAISFDVDTVDNNKEKFYRLRVIPISPSELLKKNPELWKKLNEDQKGKLEGGLDDTNGAFNLSIGTGSIITSQPKMNINFKKIAIKSKDNNFELENTGEYTIFLSSLTIYNSRNQPMYFDEVVLKPGDTKGLRHSNLKKFDGDFTPTRLSYINQFGEKINIEF